MTLAAQISSLATRVGNEFKTVRSELSTGLSGKSNNGHTHVIGDVTNLSASLSAKLDLAGDTLTDGANIAVGATTGTKIGTATTQKLGFFNATPIVQPAATTDLGTVLSGLGLRAAGTAYPITTSGAVSLTSASNVIVSARTSKAIPAILTAATTLTNTSSEIQNADATTAPFNITLPTASLTVGQHFTIKKIDASANAVTIVGTIDGVANTVLSRQNEAVTLVATTATGTWRVINRLQSVTTLIGTTATGQSLMTAADAAVVRAISGAVATDDPRLSDARTPTAHTHPATGISDSTATGRAVLTATDATAARIAIGAGTSSLALGTTSTTAKAGDYQPTWAQVTGKPTAFAPIIGSGAADAVAGNDPRLTDARTPTAHTHTASQISDSTAVGRSVVTAADAAAARTAIGAGTSNLAIGTTSTTAKAGDYQPTAANISDSTAVGRSVLTAADAAAARTALGAVQKPATQVSGSGIPWASEMIINSGALANGYNDGDGGVLVDKQIILRQVAWRIASHTATIGGSGNMQIDWYQATPTTEPGTLIATTQVAAGQHDVVVTLVTPYTVPVNTVLRAKFTMGSTTVASKSHIQWRGDIDVN